jgi:hypothetical protein
MWDNEKAKKLDVTISRGSRLPDPDESTEFHAARILLLLYYAGGQRKKSIQGRTKIAKLDFFIRYPTYLIKAAQIKHRRTTLRPIANLESRMIRFRYGPWDENYYNTFSYLVAKDLVTINNTKKGDIFQLTERGKTAAEELHGLEFEEIIERCKLVYELFGTSSGTSIKEFIYDKFPEIVAKPLGESIKQKNG